MCVLTEIPILPGGWSYFNTILNSVTATFLFYCCREFEESLLVIKAQSLYVHITRKIRLQNVFMTCVYFELRSFKLEITECSNEQIVGAASLKQKFMKCFQQYRHNVRCAYYFESSLRILTSFKLNFFVCLFHFILYVLSR